MNPDDYITVARFSNGTSGEMRIYLEMLGDEVVLSPGHEIELLARLSEKLLPILVQYAGDGIQVFAHQEPDPDWHIRFNGRIYCTGQPNPTRLADLGKLEDGRI